jgi:hypothetical protein
VIDIESFSSTMAVLIEIRRDDLYVYVIILLLHYKCENIFRFVKVFSCRIRNKNKRTGNLVGILDLILNHRSNASDIVSEGCVRRALPVTSYKCSTGANI